MMKSADDEIKVLILENERLILEVAKLRAELKQSNIIVQQQSVDIIAKDSELDLLKIQNQTLRDEVVLLTKKRTASQAMKEDRLIVMMTNELKYSKYVHAMQETTAHLQLENQLPEPYKSSLKSILTERIEDPDYIYKNKEDGDSPQLIDFKLYSLLKHIDSTPPSVRRKLNMNYEDILEQMHHVLVNLNIPDTCINHVSCEDVDALQDWWLD